MENNTVTVKQANEIGIAGFVFASILLMHDGFLNFNCTPNMFSDVHLTEQYIGVIISTILLIGSTITSIVGVKKKSPYQKGLAILGLILNGILWVALIYTFCHGYFGEPDLNSVGNRGIN
jgi:amino acid transporter